MKATVLKTIFGAAFLASFAALPLTATTEYQAAETPDGITCATPPETPAKKEQTKKEKTKKNKKKTTRKGTKPVTAEDAKG